MACSWRMHIVMSALAVAVAACGGNVALSGRDKKAEKPAAKAEPKQADSTNKVIDEETSTIIAQGPDDEDLMAIPPESIAGAYLTCAVIATETVARPPAAGNGYYGCSAYKVDDTRLDLTGVDASFRLRFKATGLDIAATRLELVDRPEDAIWEASATELAAGVTADVTIKGTDGQPYVVKKRGSTTINDGTP